MVADERGDVHIEGDQIGLSTAQRRTVDLRHLKITPSSDGPLVELRLKKVVTTGAYDQYFYVYFEDPEGVSLAYLRVKASTLRGRAAIDDGDSYADCRVKAVVSSRRKILAVMMPKNCAPTGVAKVRVLAYTTPLGKTGGDVLYSSDRLKAPSYLDLHD